MAFKTKGRKYQSKLSLFTVVGLHRLIMCTYATSSFKHRVIVYSKTTSKHFANHRKTNVLLQRGTESCVEEVWTVVVPQWL